MRRTVRLPARIRIDSVSQWQPSWLMPRSIGESLIPVKFGQEDATPLTFEVKEGQNEYPIDLE